MRRINEIDEDDLISSLDDLVDDLTDDYPDNIKYSTRKFTRTWLKEFGTVDEFKCEGLLFNRLKPPKWVKSIDWYETPVYYEALGDDCIHSFVRYIPKTEDNIGFDIIYPMGKDGKMFKQYKAMWKELSTVIHSVKVNPETGAITGSEGNLFFSELYSVLEKFIPIWDMWREFPDSSDSNLVKKLSETRKLIEKFVLDRPDRVLEKEIKTSRRNIEIEKQYIAKNEAKLNQEMENLANYLNIMEEHGYPMEVDL